MATPYTVLFLHGPQRMLCGAMLAKLGAHTVVVFGTTGVELMCTTLANVVHCSL